MAILFKGITDFVRGALTYTTAMAWNQAFQKYLERGKLERKGFWVYAFLVTILSILVVFFVDRINNIKLVKHILVNAGLEQE